MSENNTFYCSFVSIHYIICECGETFPSEDALKEHLERDKPHRDETKEVEYKCGECEKIFDTQAACMLHQDLEHVSIKEENEEISQPPQVAKALSQPVTFTVRSKPIKVESKPGRLPDPPKAKKKKPYNHRNIVCEICGKKYASNAALRYHQRVHTGERPYQCIYCMKNFTMPLFLQIHMRIHTGEKPYQCPHCPKAFTNKAALLRHDRVHTGIKPYECPKCGKTFTQSNSMKLHVHTVHLKMPAPYKSKRRRAANQTLDVQDPGQFLEVKTEIDDLPVEFDTVEEINGEEVYYCDEAKEGVTYEIIYE